MQPIGYQALKGTKWKEAKALIGRQSKHTHEHKHTTLSFLSFFLSYLLKEKPY